jgi:predicted hydrolase (HD superfamily)
MGAMAEAYGEDKEHWAAVGWLHDVDYEKYPDEHCHHVREFLEPEAVDEEDIKAIISHGYGITTEEAQPASNLEKSLFAVDELTGIIQAYALMRPERMEDMEVKSLKKKYKDKKFAAKCSREIINLGVENLGMELGDVMKHCIKGMQEHHEEIGL